MTYMTLFDDTGARVTSVPVDCTLNDEHKAALIKDGYIEIDEEEWNYYVGNRGGGKNDTGYIRGKDGKPTDAPAAPELTDDEKKARALAELDSRYTSDKQELSAQYLDAAMSEDADTMDAIKTELAALNEKYDADYAELNK